MWPLIKPIQSARIYSKSRSVFIPKPPEFIIRQYSARDRAKNGRPYDEHLIGDAARPQHGTKDSVQALPKSERDIIDREVAHAPSRDLPNVGPTLRRKLEAAARQVQDEDLERAPAEYDPRIASIVSVDPPLTKRVTGTVRRLLRKISSDAPLVPARREPKQYLERILAKSTPRTASAVSVDRSTHSILFRKISNVVPVVRAVVVKRIDAERPLVRAVNTPYTYRDSLSLINARNKEAADMGAIEQAGPRSGGRRTGSRGLGLGSYQTIRPAVPPDDNPLRGRNENVEQGIGEFEGGRPEEVQDEDLTQAVAGYLKGRRREGFRIRKFDSEGTLVSGFRRLERKTQDEDSEEAKGGRTGAKAFKSRTLGRGVTKSAGTEIEETEQGTAGIKIIKCGTFRIRTHLAESPPDFEPSVKAKTPPLLIQRFPSKPVYTLPPVNMKTDEEDKIPAQVLPFAFERPELNEEAKRARSKQMERESWLAREGQIKLAVSLLFSNRSRDSIQRLRNRYTDSEPGQRAWKQFKSLKVLHWLDYSMHAKYQAMLTRVTAEWEPFFINTTTPGHVHRNMYDVGLKMESEKLQSLVKELEENVMMMHTWDQAHRMVPTPKRLSLLPISMPIAEFNDALRTVELLKGDEKKDLDKIKVDGLILHGYEKDTDTLFPPPKGFRFYKADKEIIRYIPFVNEENVAAGINTVS